MQRDRLAIRAGMGRIKRANLWIVAWDDAILVAREPSRLAPSLCHRTKIVDDWEGVLFVHVGVVVAGVARENDRASLGHHAHHLQSVAVAAGMVHADAFGDFGIAIVKLDALA